MTRYSQPRFGPFRSGDKPPIAQHEPQPAGESGALLMVRVGGVLRRRAHYIARAIYYAAVHRSFKHVRWALAAEGTAWN